MMETRSTARPPASAAERPFYELDDEELILAEAADAALSDGRPERAAPALSAPPGIVLRATIDAGVLDRLQAIADQNPVFSILEHARIVNACACSLDREGRDRYGVAALLRHENGLLQLDRIAPGDAPRTINGLRPEDVVDALCAAPPADRKPAPAGLTRRLTAGDLPALAPLAREENRFLAMRRLTLALMPTSANLDLTAESVRDYAFSLRIFVNALAARWSLLSWPELRAYYAEDADAAARACIRALRRDAERPA